MKNLIEKLQPLVGRKFLTVDLQYTLHSKLRPYLDEVNSEIDDIAGSVQGAKGRTRPQISEVALKGKLAEIIVREFSTTQALVEHSTKKYHDLYYPAGQFHVECKVWKANSITTNIQQYLIHDAVHYNTSKLLLVFTYDDQYTWLEKIVDVEKENTSVVLEVQKQGKTFTISQKLYENLIKTDNDICFIDGDKTVYKTFEWFRNNKRESFRGASAGGWFVYADQF